MKLVAYLRISSNGQLDGYGFEGQREDIHKWAAHNGHEIVDERSDVVTGKTDGPDRDGLREALQMIRSGDVDGIVAGRMDRIARQLTVQEAILALVWREGRAVFTADFGEVAQDDDNDPMRTALRQIVGVFAELDRKMVVKRLRDGRRIKAASGKHAVGQYAYGSQGIGEGRDRDAGPRDDEQVSIARIVELRTGGASYRAICEALDAAGLKPRRAAAWSAMSVRGVALRAGCG